MLRYSFIRSNYIYSYTRHTNGITWKRRIVFWELSMSFQYSFDWYEFSTKMKTMLILSPIFYKCYHRTLLLTDFKWVSGTGKWLQLFFSVGCNYSTMPYISTRWAITPQSVFVNHFVKSYIFNSIAMFVLLISVLLLLTGVNFHPSTDK